MTNVSGTLQKIATRANLFQAALDALRQQGWVSERIARSGKSSVRRITKGKVSKTISIRTSQDTWIAFPRNRNDDGWATLADVDFVVASTVDSRDNPRFAQVHLLDAEEMRSRYDRAYTARKKADYSIPIGRGIWLSLYDKETNYPVTLVGAGAGLDHPPIAKVPLTAQDGEGLSQMKDELDPEDVELERLSAASPEQTQPAREAPLTIREAKRRLALSLGVDEDAITITINH